MSVRQDEPLPSQLIKDGKVVKTSLLPERHEIVEKYLRGRPIKSIAEEHGLKPAQVSYLCKKVLREYRARNNAQVKNLVAELDARMDLVLNKAWSLVDECDVMEDKIRALDILNRVMTNKISLVKVISASEDQMQQHYQDCMFVVVNDREEWQAVNNRIVDATQFHRIAGDKDGETTEDDVGSDDQSEAKGVSGG